MDHGESGVRILASVEGFRGRAECSWDPLNKSPRPSHPRNGRMTALPFAVNSAAIDSKCRLVLHPVPWRAGSRDLSRGSPGIPEGEGLRVGVFTMADGGADGGGAGVPWDHIQDPAHCPFSVVCHEHSHLHP